MYSFFCFISILFYSCNSEEQNHQNDWQRKFLKDSVAHLQNILYLSYDDFKNSINGKEHHFIFNEAGFLTESIEELAMGQKRSITYSYTKNHLLTSQLLILGKDNITPEKYFKYELDNHGRYQQCIAMAQDSSINYYIDYDHSEENKERLIFRTGENAFITPCKIVRNKDHKNRITEEKKFPKDELGKCKQSPIRSVFSYNINGDLERMKVFNENQELELNISYEYRYDDHLNWIYRLQYNGDIPTNVVIRKISYY